MVPRRLPRLRIAGVALLILTACGGEPPPPDAAPLRGWDGEVIADDAVPQSSSIPAVTAPEALAQAAEVSTDEDDRATDDESADEESVEDQPTAAELEAESRLERGAWAKMIEADAAPLISSCGPDPLDDGLAGNVLRSSNPDCDGLVVPERPCLGKWGTLPGLPEVLVVLNGLSDNFDEQLRIPDNDELTAVVCMTDETVWSRSVAEFFVPCDGARNASEPWKLEVGQRLLDTTAEWYAYGSSEPVIAAEHVFFGGCERPASITGDPTVDLFSVSVKDDIVGVGDRIVDVRGTWADLYEHIEPLHVVGSLMQEEGTDLTVGACDAVSEFGDAFEFAADQAGYAFQYPISWLSVDGQHSGWDHRYAVQLSTDRRKVDAAIRDAVDAADAAQSVLGVSPAESWIADEIGDLRVVIETRWPELLDLGEAATTQHDVYEAIDSAALDAVFTHHQRRLGVLKQVRESATCTGQGERRSDWLNPEMVFAPPMWGFDEMFSSRLTPFTPPVTPEECVVADQVNAVGSAVTLAAARDVFSSSEGVRFNVTALSLDDSIAGETAVAAMEAASRECPSDGVVAREIAVQTSFPSAATHRVFITQEREDSAVVWLTHVQRGNLLVRFAMHDATNAANETFFKHTLEEFRIALRDAPGELQIFPSDLQ